MIVKPIQTDKILANQMSLSELLDRYLKTFPNKGVLAVTSKVVSLCEGRIVPIEGTDKEELIKAEADYFLASSASKYGYNFTITNNTLISMAGIDKSNGNDCYVLWPKDSQATANQLRQYLIKRFKIKYAGVVIVDSTCTPFRLGTSGIALGFSGFSPLNDYVGQPDLFGRAFEVSKANIAGGLAASAVMVMGEGVERQPLVVMSDVPFVQFQTHDPTEQDLETLNIPLEDDLYAPFLTSVKWQLGKQKS